MGKTQHTGSGWPRSEPGDGVGGRCIPQGLTSGEDEGFGDRTRQCLGVALLQMEQGS